MTPTTTDPARRCRVVKLDATDLARAVDDPGLAAFIADGWTVLASAHVTDETEAGERSSLALLLAPPRPVVVEPTPIDWAKLGAASGLSFWATVALLEGLRLFGGL